MPKVSKVVLALAVGWALACAGTPPNDAAESTEGAPKPAAAEATANSAPTKSPSTAASKNDEVAVIDAWMVVTATHKSKEASEADFPKGSAWPGELYDTSKVEGLKPGLWVRSPLITLQEAPAQQGARYYQERFPGAYVRKVRLLEYCRLDADACRYRPDVASHAIDCSAELPHANCLLGDGSWRVIIGFDFRPPDQATEDWSYTSGAVMNNNGMGGVSTVWTDTPVVELPGRSGETLDIRTVTDEPFGYVFVGSSTEPVYEGQSMEWMSTFQSASRAFGVDLIPIGFR